MSLETGSRIQDLVATNPVGATDFISQGDDHIRLLKACVQGSFPSLGPTAVAVTAEKLNFTAGLTSDAQTQLDARQPLDTDLTAIAALTTSSHGRGFLTQADAAASRSYIGAQADDADLTAIAALTTASYGRDFLTLADNAALATKIAAMAQVWTGVQKFTGDYFANTAVKGVQLGGHASVDGAGVTFVNAAAGSNAKLWNLLAYNGAFSLIAVKDDWSDSREVFSATRSGYGIASISYGNATDLPTHTFNGPVKMPSMASSTSTTLAKGQCHFVSSNVTLPNLAQGEWVAIFNTSTPDIVISKASATSMFWGVIGFTGSTLATVTIGGFGMLLCVGVGSSDSTVNGNIKSYT